MKTITKFIFGFAMLALACGSIAFAQQNSWSVNNESRNNIATDKAVARQSFPKEFKSFNLNIEPLRQQLFSIAGSDARQRSTVIVLPNADGEYEQFEVFEASNFEPDLQARFPEIRAYSGKGITDKYATLKLSISPQGIQTMVFRTDKENEFIEPYSHDHTVYAVYKSHRERGRLPWTCFTEDKQAAADIDSQLPHGPLSNTGELKTMRLAQSCTAEYSNFFGAFNPTQVALVLAAYNATLTRCNGVYEKDLALHLNLIANTTDVIYYDPNTQPYSPANIGAQGAWSAELQNTLTNVIGEANYDIGHLFGASGGGGNAGCIGCVCVDGQKGSGFTSPADGIPKGDNFDIDFVTHEVGHQMGGNHTWSFATQNGLQPVEVGAGITIMGYAGLGQGPDPAPHSIDIFHERSIQQIQVNMATKTCPITTVMTGNHPPVVAPVSNYTIPITTPFALTGSATDPENDSLTYCWEQNDNGNATVTRNNSVAFLDKRVGPNWLSFPATLSPTRLCPSLSTILAGLLVTPPFPGGDAINIEALSSVSRTLNFRLTVRDNHPYVPRSTIGQTQFTDMTVTVTNTSGPFQVTSPNTNVRWASDSIQTIMWNVAGTTGPPVSCAAVKISLSTDGGTTFPTLLSASTPNDGSKAVRIPNLFTTTATARVKVEAVGNIFFDISDSDFTITAGSQLSNVSTRAFVQTGDNVMIGGFMVQGTEPQRVIIRAIGPALTRHGVPDPLANPTLELYDGTGALIASNNNWMTTIIGGIITTNQVHEIQASGRAPGDPLDSAIIADLPAGNYTAIVRGVNNTTGVALVEVYNLSPETNSILSNISTRSFVQTGDNVMIGGFMVQGAGPERLIIRAIGPELTRYGIPNPLADPTLELHDATGALIASNNTWLHTIIGGIITSNQVDEIQASGHAPGDPRESAIIAELPAGNYTAIVRGANNTTGVALVEVYKVEASDFEPLSSSLSAQTSTRLSGDKF